MVGHYPTKAGHGCSTRPPNVEPHSSWFGPFSSRRDPLEVSIFAGRVGKYGKAVFRRIAFLSRAALKGMPTCLVWCPTYLWLPSPTALPRPGLNRRNMPGSRSCQGSNSSSLESVEAPRFPPSNTPTNSPKIMPSSWTPGPSHSVQAVGSLPKKHPLKGAPRKKRTHPSTQEECHPSRKKEESN